MIELSLMSADMRKSVEDYRAEIAFTSDQIEECAKKYNDLRSLKYLMDSHIQVYQNLQIGSTYYSEFILPIVNRMKLEIEKIAYSQHRHWLFLNGEEAWKIFNMENDL